jgi:hypothetical protein
MQDWAGGIQRSVKDKSLLSSHRLSSVLEGGLHAGLDRRHSEVYER